MEIITSMFSPEQNQISICLLKSNLEDFERALIEQHAAWPELDAENEQKCRNTFKILREVRCLSEQSEQLNQKNVRLVAKRMELKRQSDDIKKSLDKAIEKRENMKKELYHEEQEMESHIRKYEDSLREKADRFRKTRGYYNEEEMRGEIAKVENTIISLEAEANKGRAVVDKLRRHLDVLQSDVPEDLLTIIGKEELDATLKSLTNKCETLKQKRDDLLNNK